MIMKLKPILTENEMGEEIIIGMVDSECPVHQEGVHRKHTRPRSDIVVAPLMREK